MSDSRPIVTPELPADVRGGCSSPSHCSAEMSELLFAIEAALPFVESHVGTRMCSSSGGPVALKNILKKYDWDKQRWKWVFPPNNDSATPVADPNP